MNYQATYNFLEKLMVNQGFRFGTRDKSGSCDNGMGSLIHDNEIKRVIFRTTATIEEKTKMLVQMLWTLNFFPDTSHANITESDLTDTGAYNKIMRATVGLVDFIANSFETEE